MENDILGRCILIVFLVIIVVGLKFRIGYVFVIVVLFDSNFKFFLKRVIIEVRDG